MSLCILATGSRGDVQPFVALGAALVRAGQPVTLVTNQIFADWAAAYGLTVRPITWDPVESMRRQPDLDGASLPQLIAGVRQIRASNRAVLIQAQRECWAACQAAAQDGQGPGHLVYSALSPWGASIAEALRIPALAGLLHPLLPTREFPMQLIPRSLGGALNRASHTLGDFAMDSLIKGLVNDFRRELGLPPIRFPHTLAGSLRSGEAPLLVALSPTITPRPADWPARAVMRGYWFLPAAPGWQPAPALVDFLQSGPPPVYLGFGSMASQRPADLLEIARAALRQTGQRGILAAGWSGLPAGLHPGPLLVIAEAPHDWLFPRCAAVAHHCGAGTTAAGLRAGVPAVGVPHMQDQFYWAARLHALGVAPAPLPRRQLTAETLADRLAAAQSPLIRQTAARLGECVRAEDGPGAAVEVILNWMGRA